MMTLNELRKKKDLIKNIDWTITQERTSDGNLEQSAGWNRGNNESLYFVISDQETKPQVTLVKRKMDEVIELAKIPVPSDLFRESYHEDRRRSERTLHPLNETLKQWVATVLGDAPGMLQ